MRLTNFISSMGRVVAYYPNLKKITHSTTATILLCQFFYWIDKSTDNGWIWKTSDEIEEETGLTYNEQKTARDKLVELKFIEEENKRLDHMMRFRVNHDAVNNAWEALYGQPTIEVKKENNPLMSPDTAESYFADKARERQQAKPVESRVVPGKKGDLVDAMIATANSSGMKRADSLVAIKEKLSKMLKVNPYGKKWEDFIGFAADRESKDNEKIEVFIAWALKNGYSPIYWPPEKMTNLWPQAFIKEPEYVESFIEEAPKTKQQNEDFAPPPEGFGRRNRS